MQRRSLVCLLGCALLGSLASAGEKGETKLVILHQVQPEYGPDLEKSYVVDPLEVLMLVDSEGVPYSLEVAAGVPVTGGIPDAVVRALSQWRYQPAEKKGRNSPVETPLLVPVRKRLNKQVELTLRRVWQPESKMIVRPLEKGVALDASGAEQIERSLHAKPRRWEDRRITLLAYYTNQAAKATNAEDALKSRSRLIAWFVENQPEAYILASPLAIINAPGGPLSDAAGYEEVRRLWFKQLELRPADHAVLCHATNFLRIADPERTERALLPWLTKSSQAVIWLGDLYGLAAIGVTSLDPATGLAATPGTQLPESQFARKARTALISSDDARLLFSGLSAISRAGRSLSKAGHVPSGYMAFCEELLNRARQMYPATAASCDPDARLPEDRQTVETPRVGGSLPRAIPLKQIRPQYPSEARSRGIQGTVLFNATIGKDGKAANLFLVSGRFVFYDSARAVVLQSAYKPMLLNGQPAEFETTISVVYKLSP